MPARPTPFDLVFGQIAPDRFAAVRGGLESSARDPRDRDAFLLEREVAELLRELRPEGGLGEAMAGFAALVHHAYLFWLGGQRVRSVGEGELREMLRTDREGIPASRRPDLLSRYIHLPPLAVWGRLEDRPPEPLDGWFVLGTANSLAVLAVFGLHPGRPGLTAVEVAGPRPPPSSAALLRPDGSPVFAPITTETGARAGIAAVTGNAELLELAWRAEDLS